MDVFTPEKRSHLMSLVRGKDTKPELIVRKLLHRLGYRFRLHRRDLPGKPDIVLPRYKTAIFVHGCFWHGHNCKGGARPSSNVEFWNDKLAKNIVRDQVNVNKLKLLGWRCIIVWQCETRNEEALEKKLKAALK
jgi:DNA mismatch endonuclease (patch repair protein)